MSEAYIVDYIRMPIGRFGGALSAVSADDLAAALRALVEHNPSLDFGAVDDVILGCANQAGEDNRNVARMAVLLAGLPETVPVTTINRLCGSGMDATLAAARMIKAGEADLVISGGVESMSRVPFVMPKATSAFSRNAEIYDTTIGWRFVNPVLKKQYGVDSMPETGENVAADFSVSRADRDAFAVRSQEKTVAAQENGRLAKEIVSVTIPQRKGDPIVVDKDEHPRPGTTVEKLGKLPTPFRENGSVTAGNASGINGRRGRSDHRFGSCRQQIRPDADRAHSGWGGRRCGAAHHGLRSGPGLQEADDPPRSQGGGSRRDRAERGLRLPGHRGAQGSGRGG